MPGIPKGINVDKELEKKGRGSYEELVCQSTYQDLYYVKWYDNKIVNLISTFVRTSPVAVVERYDSKEKKVVEVSCPDIIQRYNKSMGGVDLADCLIALYRINLRSKKYYMRLIFHMIDMVMVNSWLLYRRDAESLSLQRKDIRPLASFKLAVAHALVKKGKAAPVK